jgi:hypothetical protein
MAHLGAGSILDIGVQDAPRPRRGPSPPEDLSKTKVLTNLLFARCCGPGHDLKEVRDAEAVLRSSFLCTS